MVPTGAFTDSWNNVKATAFVKPTQLLVTYLLPETRRELDAMLQAEADFKRYFTGPRGGENPSERKLPKEFRGGGRWPLMPSIFIILMQQANTKLSSLLCTDGEGVFGG